MKNTLFAVLVILAVLSLPGCCCMQPVCMPTMCMNPCWMEDLQDDYCQFSGAMRAKFCCFQQQTKCRMAQLSAKFSCPCQQCSQGYQQPYPCNDCLGHGQFNSIQNPNYLPGGPTAVDQNFSTPGITTPGLSTQNYPPASINPTQEPASAPPALGPAVLPPPPSDSTSQPAPVPVPKINPSAASQPPAMIPADPSIPLEFQTNMNQVGFRKAEIQRQVPIGWKPVAALPNALR